MPFFSCLVSSCFAKRIDTEKYEFTAEGSERPEKWGGCKIISEDSRSLVKDWYY